MRCTLLYSINSKQAAIEGRRKWRERRGRSEGWVGGGKGGKRTVQYNQQQNRRHKEEVPTLLEDEME